MNSGASEEQPARAAATPYDPLRLAEILASVGWLGGIALSVPLWLGERAIPYAPLAPFGAPQALHDLLFVGLAASLLLVLWRGGRAGAVAIGCWLVLALWDQARLQPWALFYAGIIAAAAIARTARPRAGYALSIAIVASLYFWSGIQKLNVSFVQETFPWFAGPWVSLWGGAAESAAHAAVAVALVEAAIGAGLLFAATRIYALWGAAVMLVFVLGALGPWGHDWNAVVWPWNIAVCAIAWVLLGKHRGTARAWWSDLRSNWHAMAIGAVFGIFPALSFFNAWDDYLSAGLYSGAIAQGWITLTPRDAAALAPGVPADPYPDGPGAALPLVRWYLQTTGVPGYPEPRVYESVARTLCREGRFAESGELLITGRRYIVGTYAPITRFVCADGVLERRPEVQ